MATTPMCELLGGMAWCTLPLLRQVVNRAGWLRAKGEGARAVRLGQERQQFQQSAFAGTTLANEGQLCSPDYVEPLDAQTKI